jgi:two-component system, chemotaxis family, protein-glutamate methylesterase/glutaminase
VEAARVISVLVVDDSVVVRRLVTDALADDPGIRVIATAPNGRVALQKIENLKPDLVTLDVEMPVLDGLATLRELRRSNPRLPVIMFSALTAAGATATLDALSAGASDYVTKPANVGSVSESIRGVREQLIPRIYALCERRGAAAAARPGRPPTAPTRPAGPEPGARGGPGARPSAPPAGAASPGVRRGPKPVTRGPRAERVDVIAIGCSTGGPDALSRMVRGLPGNLPVPVLVVQHMPPVFTRMFAERLDRTSQLTVVEAAAGMTLHAGNVYIAPGDFHLEIQRSGTAVTTLLSSGPPENFCRPAVDVLFRSVNKVYGNATLGVVLTGMGHDGRRGAEALVASGAEIVVPDEATSVVWGMPGAVATAGLATAVLPLDEIGRYLITRVNGGRTARSMEVTR